MRASIVFALASAGAVMADLSGQPACASSCLSAAISGAGCKLDDSGCQCGPAQQTIIQSAGPCLLQACTAATDLVQAQSAGSAACVKFSATATQTGASTASSGVPSTGAGATTSAPAPTSHSNTTTTASSSSSSSGNAAAATPVAWGPVGALAALLGAVVAL